MRSGGMWKKGAVEQEVKFRIEESTSTKVRFLSKGDGSHADWIRTRSQVQDQIQAQIQGGVNCWQGVKDVGLEVRERMTISAGGRRKRTSSV